MRSRALALVVLPLLGAGLVSCIDPATLGMLGDIKSMTTPKVSGQLATRSPSGEVQTVSFDDCQSGQDEGFFGVDLVSSVGPDVLRVTQDPIDGVRARLTRPGASTAFGAADCATLDASIAKSGISVNRVALLQGSVTLDCHDTSGSSYKATVGFSACHSSATAAKTVASVSGKPAASLPPAALIPPHTPLPALPPSLTALSVRPSPRVVGGAQDAASLWKAADGCRQKERSLFEHLGFRVVDDDSADLDAEMACSGDVTLLDTPTSLTIVLPPSFLPSLTLRSGGQVVDTVAHGPSAFRCEQPASPERTTRCAASADEASTARIADLLSASRPLADLARKKHPSAR